MGEDKDQENDTGLPEGFSAVVNARLTEVLVYGWPYVFLVAMKDICAGEEIAIDYGEAHWSCQRALASRFDSVARMGTQIIDPDGSIAAAEREKAKRKNKVKVNEDEEEVARMFPP